MSGLRAAPISPARCWARCSSAGSPTGSGASGCSSSRSRSISSPPRRPRCRGTSRALRCFASSPAPASAANTPPSIRASRSWCRRATAVGPISSSTAASGSAPRSAPRDRWCCSIPTGWRLAFLIGAVLGLVIFLMRLWLPESPRWLMTHGRVEEATAVLDGIEAEFRARGHEIPDEPLPVIRLRARRFTPLAEVADTLFRVERRRTLVGLSLMAAQAFFYNAIFFTYALVLTDFYAIPADHIGWYLLPFAAGNFLGPVFLGRLFDTIGRRPMIATTYALSGVLLAGVGYLFAAGVLSATGQTIAWMVIFFFASAAASSAYLTVSETFPLEVRALAIAFFYALG